MGRKTREENKARIIAGLRQRGYSINSIDDLMRMSSKERELIPFLAGVLEQFTDERDKERGAERCRKNQEESEQLWDYSTDLRTKRRKIKKRN